MNSVPEIFAHGKTIHPRAIHADSEEATILRQLFFGDDSTLCQGQQAEHIQWRRASLLLMLQYLREAGVIEDSLAYSFRWACVTRYLPDGRPWPIPEPISNAVLAWGSYQRNDLLNYCLECIFYAALKEVDREPCRPNELVTLLADQAMAAIPGDANRPSFPALPSKVADWVTATHLPDASGGADPWGPLSTRGLADWLESALADDDMIAVRIFRAWIVREVNPTWNLSTNRISASVSCPRQFSSAFSNLSRSVWFQPPRMSDSQASPESVPSPTEKVRLTWESPSETLEAKPSLTVPNFVPSGRLDAFSC